jgi:hypothetical protein
MSKQASRSFAASADRRFKFHKRGEYFFGADDETLSIGTICVCNSAAAGLPWRTSR